MASGGERTVYDGRLRPVRSLRMRDYLKDHSRQLNIAIIRPRSV